MSMSMLTNDRRRNYGVLADVPAGSDLVGALSAGDLLWSVEGLPISAYHEGDNFELKGYQCISRISPFDTPIPLGIVSDNYVPLQNLECFAPLESLRLDGRLSYSQAGGTKHGARVFVLCDLASTTSITGEDAHVRRLLATTSHDGTGALRLVPVIHRLACTNALPMLGRFRKAILSVPHNSLASGRVQDLNADLDRALVTLGQMESEYEKLMTVKVHQGDVEAFLSRLFPKKGSATERMNNTVERNRDSVRKIYAGSTGTQEVLHGTAAGLLAASIEWDQHARGASADRRATRLLEGRSDALYTRAWDLAGAL